VVACFRHFLSKDLKILHMTDEFVTERETEDQKRLPSRSTRGRRLHDLVGEEATADEEFWRQDFFADVEDDAEYYQEAEEEDIVDADFDIPEEPEPDAPVDEDGEKPDKKKKKGITYVDPAVKAKKKAKEEKRIKKPKRDEMEYYPMDEEPYPLSPQPPSPSTSGKAKGYKSGAKGSKAKLPIPLPSTPENPTSPRAVRESTRAMSIEKSIEREYRDRELEKKRIEKKKNLYL